MEIDKVRELCLAMHPEVTEDIPFEKFGSEDVAFRIRGKIFAFLLVDDSRMVVLKCDETRAVELRERYVGAIEPAFHWNKKYWNQVHYNSSALPLGFVEQLIAHAFELVVAKLPLKTRRELLLQ